MKFGIFTLFALILSFNISVKAEGWNGIYPLKSTRADVERILGKCASGNNTWHCLYKFEEKNITVRYSLGGCERGFGWNVPEGTVLGITIYLKKRLKIADLGFNLKEFIDEEDPELPEYRHFSNEHKGIGFVLSNETVTTIYYTPTENERKQYKCIQRTK